MARGINKVILMGNLGNDPEVRYTAGGSAVANVSIATTESWKDKESGEQQEKTEWHRVVFFNRLAEIVAEYLKKGSQVYVEGRLQTRKWQDKDLGNLPALDEKGRPLFAYGRTIHEDCPRRAHFDAGRFANQFGDEGHRQGWCLYKLGCKGPATHANCSLMRFGETDSWPIGTGHPCFGCTEQALAFRVPMHDTVPIERPTPPDTYPPIRAEQGNTSTIAAGVAGLAVGAAVGAMWAASKKADDGGKTGRD